MSIARPSNSECLSPCKVTSKYFTSNTVMDESLSEFEEKKVSCTGPRNTQRQVTNKNRSKKPKHIRGQKDIRVALHSKKNELISYTKNFNDICKQSGVDVDSEQLQLAIALSKSLQQTESNDDDNDTQSSGSLSYKERTGRIRTTLKEYGFKVPNKITATTNKKLNKHRKEYKLLLTTAEERRQVINDKYSQILLENIGNPKLINDANIDQVELSVVKLYHLTTQAPYEILKNENVFYVDNLLEKSPNTVGCLLRNWSEIPGRPASPVCYKNSNIKFSKIECLQSELDTILSASFESVKDFFKRKNKLSPEENSTCNNMNNHKEIDANFKSNSLHEVEIPLDDETKESNDEINTLVTLNQECPKMNCDAIEMTDIETRPMLRVLQQARSISPDIFDEDVSSIVDNTKENIETLSQTLNCNRTTKENNDFMDLTECVNVISQNALMKIDNISNESKFSQQSKDSNVTTRKPNDFMEITECVAMSTQTVFIQENIDLTQNSDHDNMQTKEQNEIVIESMDLTQSSDSNDDTLPFVQISGSKRDSLDDTIIINDKEYVNLHGESLNSVNKKNYEGSELLSNVIPLCAKIKEPINSTKDTHVSVEITEANKSSSDIIFEDNTYRHSDDSNRVRTLVDTHILCLDECKNAGTKSDVHFDRNDSNNDIDLTQTSHSSEEIVNEICTNKIKSPKIVCDVNNCLGKKDNVSIDYDEVSLNENRNYTISKNENYDNKIGFVEEHFLNSDSEHISNSSKKSEIFEISDDELNYSLHKSKHEMPKDNFDFGGISVMDNMSSTQSYRKSYNNTRNSSIKNKVSLNNCKSDSSFPIVDINSSRVSNSTSDNNVLQIIQKPCISESTPSKESIPNNARACATTTPNCNKYIIKTDNVTPMLDYASMSSPERNKELDKYGLKPFKRKRAVQLLTYLYNQTHPIVEACSTEELPSPSKKRKEDTNSRPHKSPKKQLKCTEMVLERSLSESIDNENNLYEVTNEQADLQNLDCSPEDWVFQKREKVKVHSCRVPLHIALHNYVSCRRRLREAILRYDPINIDVIHKQLAVYGHRYDPKDLLKFMDKKCITVKTADKK